MNCLIASLLILSRWKFNLCVAWDHRNYRITLIRHGIRMLNNWHTTRIITFFLLSAKPIFFRCAYANKGKMRGKNMENVLGLKLSLVQLQSRSVSTSTFSTRILNFFLHKRRKRKRESKLKKKMFLLFCFLFYSLCHWDKEKNCSNLYTRSAAPEQWYERLVRPPSLVYHFES